MAVDGPVTVLATRRPRPGSSITESAPRERTLTAAMTWLVMPALARAFARFLYRPRPQ